METFNGFPKQTIEFLSALKRHNTVDWFNAHKPEYIRYVKQPSEQFVMAMGKELESVLPGINAIPKVNKSLFRMNRDTRFSKDKSPYKTNLGIMFWQGEGKRMERPCFYFHLEEDFLMLGCGLHMFTRPVLNNFRKALVQNRNAEKLHHIVTALEEKEYVVGTRHYKRIPKGFDLDPPLSDYLLFNGLAARMEVDGVPLVTHTEMLTDYVLERYKAMADINRWLLTYLL